MNDSRKERGILHHIEQLVAEEHRLISKGALDDHEKATLDRAKVDLDQCWDLLRQRRAKLEFGDNPSEASVRSASVVEKYEG